jgi:membrane protease YdiL (CAAX protease family)
MSERGEQQAALFDVLFVLLAICAAWVLTRWALYPALSVPANAPMILRPIAGFLTAWLLLCRRGQSFVDVGFGRPASLWRALLGAALLYLAQMAASEWLSPWLADVLHAQSQPSIILYIRGKLVPFLGWLAIGWLVGAFAEELLFRGFLLRRLSQLVGGGALGAALGVLGQAVLFGALHLYAGPFAFVHSAIFAVLSGAAFLLAGQNLWPLILVHGVWNSLGVWSVYAS